MTRAHAACAVGLAACLVVLGGSAAAETGTAPGEPRAAEPAERAELERRIEELEARERARAERDAVEEENTASDSPWPPFTVGGFANVDYVFEDRRLAAGDRSQSNHFALGELDIFLVSQLSDRFSVLAETVVEFESQGENVVDVERLRIQYEHRDWLAAAIGRGHVPVGHWNRAYHHGTFLWPTIERPLLFAFEDDGGILPMHFVGLELSGRIEVARGLVEYVAIVSNGRGRSIEAIQLTDDLNDGKMVSLQLVWRPLALSDLVLGINGIYDDIPDDPFTVGREAKLHEYIAGGHVIWSGMRSTLFAEAQYIRHEGGGKSYDSFGGYAQVGHQFADDWNAYYRFDLREINEDDLFLATQPDAIDTRLHTIGVRFDWTSFLALKLEYRRESSAGTDANIGATQVTVRF